MLKKKVNEPQRLMRLEWRELGSLPKSHLDEEEEMP